MQNKFTILITALLLFINFNSGICQKFAKSNPVNIPNFVKLSDANSLVSSFLAKHKFIKIENFLPKNYVKDGTVDYTNYLQKVLNENKNVVFPNFPIRI